MTKNAPLLRPAASAIAAFLVLSTPAAFAQEATVPMTPPVSMPPTSAPPTVQPPATTAPVTAPTAQPAPQPVIRVPLDLPPAPKAEREAAAAPARARAERTAPRPRPAQAAPARVTAAPVATAAAPIEEAAPVAPVVVEPVQPTAETAPAAVEKAAPATSDSFPWEIVGGAAALLIVGGAGIAFARRRKTSKEVWEFDENSGAEWVPTADPPAEPTFARTETVAAPEPLPVQPATTPAFAAAPSGSMGRHEAMAMAGPTPDNPFTTLSKRLARARFLDRQERADYDAALATSEPQAEPAPVRKPVSAWEIAQRQTVPAAPAEQEVRRLQPGSVRKDLKPGWTRN